MIQNAVFPSQTHFAITAVEQLCTKIALFKHIALLAVFVGVVVFAFFFVCLVSVRIELG